MKLHKFKYILIFTLILSVFVSDIVVSQDFKPHKLMILFSNDHHGNFYKNSKGEGGFSAMSSLVNKLRSEAIANGYVPLVLSAGDFNTGVPESDLQNATPDILAMNYIGFDAMALGNHEFDNTLSILAQQIDLAQFPMLSANIVYKSNNKPVYRSSVSYYLDGLKIAILGLTTEETPILTNPDNYKNIKFRNPVEVAREQVQKLAKDHDFIIALTHLGVGGIDYQSQSTLDDDLAVIANLPLVIGGHSHTLLVEPKMVNNTIIVQAGSYNRYLGRIDLSINDGIANVDYYKVYPINLKKSEGSGEDKKLVFIEDEIKEDEKLLSILDEYQQKGAELLNVQVGKTEGLFVGERALVRSQETNLGNLIAYVTAKAVQADVSVMNSGGIRASLPEGVVNYRDILVVQPFGNTITSVDLSGSELLAYIQDASEKNLGSGGFPQFYGVKFKTEAGKITDIQVAGAPLDMQRTYKLAVNNFLASGGDGYIAIKNKDSYVDSGLVDAHVLKEYFEEVGTVKAADFAVDGKFIVQ